MGVVSNHAVGIAKLDAAVSQVCFSVPTSKCLLSREHVTIMHLVFYVDIAIIRLLEDRSVSATPRSWTGSEAAEASRSIVMILALNTSVLDAQLRDPARALVCVMMSKP